jgi:hypothetical protein
MISKRTTSTRLGVILVAALVLSSFAGVAVGAVDHFSDDNGNIHEANINYIADLGVTAGCNVEGTLYCPGDNVTRAEMATFLSVAFKLPAATTNYFTDDNGNIHEANINRIAQAGITAGCNKAGTAFCPASNVTRGEMATFLTQAMSLVPWSAYYFTDVPTTYPYHAANINALAGHGITAGCNAGSTNYCPADPVKRDQMATFLARSLQLGAARAPVVNITLPANLATIFTTFNGSVHSATVSFASTVTDVNGGTPVASWRSSEPVAAWQSGLGTAIGSGYSPTPTLTIPAIQQSSQPTIQEYASDSGGLFAMDQIQLKLVIPSPSSP